MRDNACLTRSSRSRAAAFDPLTLELDRDVRAISPNAWFSLGRHGVGLHYARATNVISTVTVLTRGARGKRWEVVIDGRVMESFSKLEDAVEAVDHEIESRGRAAAASARHDAPWRYEAARSEVVARLRARAGAITHAEALRLVVWEAVTRR